MLVLIYAGFAGLAWLARAQFDGWPRIHRAAWTAAWSAVTLDLMFNGGQVNFQLMWLVYLWQALALRAWPERRILAAVLVMFVASLATRYELGAAVAGLCGGLLGGWIDWSMRARRYNHLRTVLYWSCFVGTFYVLLPWELTRRFPRALPFAGGAHVLVAIALVGAGAVIARLSTVALTRTGGTPDPSNAPEGLCTSGIYAYLRHPMQLAQVLFVWGAALLFGSSVSLVYALGFSLILTGFVRLIEERRLSQKYGSLYAEYSRRTPSYRFQVLFCGRIWPQKRTWNLIPPSDVMVGHARHGEGM